MVEDIDRWSAQLGLTRAEIDEAERQDPSGLARAALIADYMVHRAQGPAAIVEIIKRDIRAAARQGDMSRASVLAGALRLFVKDNPPAPTQAGSASRRARSRSAARHSRDTEALCEPGPRHR